ncbi:MAG TPA: MBL fold metallo-hydrolase [Acidobacteriaceae bacterium]|jgi:beta-lactamase superfamily II metal-dependent hydrolase|nr:MBL fold metallo-hydrolase [Acidobacteriaceae bacterium]
MKLCGWNNLRGRLVGAVMVAGMVCCSLAAQQSKLRKKHFQAAEPLTVYFIDVEGGQSTLFVTPEHQSLLIDTGWPDNAGRDADRIVAVAKLADLDHIDFVLLTHYHTDHTGGVPQLVARIPVVEFIDHGPLRETNDPATVKAYAAYELMLEQSHTKHILATVGMKLPLYGLTATVVSADGNLLDAPMPGAGEANAYCKVSAQRPADQTENARSVGTVFQYGKLRLIDLGDLTWDKEMQLMCPNNKLGKVDVYIVSHHGWDQSGSPAFVDGIAPRIAVMDNGENKGGSPSTWEIIEKSPRLKNLWQLHYSAEGGATHNVATQYIANPKGTHMGYYLKLTAWPNGRLVMYNPRTRQSTVYPAP